MRPRLSAYVLAAAVILGSASVAAGAAGPKPPAHVPGMPNVVLVSGCIPAMGYHYADPKTLPFGPIYGWYQGKWIFTEIMPTTYQLSTAHQSFDNVLKPLPGYTINHTDFWYEKNGHPGYWAPHYDIHAFYTPHAEQMHYCGDTAGVRMEFSKGPKGEVIMTPMHSN